MDFIESKIFNDDYKVKSAYPDNCLRKSNPDVYKELLRQYYEEERELLSNFKHDLEKEFGTENHPIKDQLYQYAWSEGHASGLYEVYNKYYDLYSNLIAPMNKYLKK